MTRQQRKALELYFDFIAKEHQNLGLTFNYEVIGLSFELPFTRVIVREQIWKPIQKALFDIDSTKELDTKMIDTIIDVFNKYLSEKGCFVPFPNIQELMNKIDKNEHLLILTAEKNEKRAESQK